MSETPLEISCQELAEAQQSGEEITLIDCREPDEHALVALPGSRLVPMAEVPSRVDEIAASRGRLVVYCHHGMRSAQTAQWLRGAGVATAQSLAGGIDAWATTIDPTLARY